MPEVNKAMFVRYANEQKQAEEGIYAIIKDTVLSHLAEKRGQWVVSARLRDQINEEIGVPKIFEELFNRSFKETLYQMANKEKLIRKKKANRVVIVKLPVEDAQ